MLIGAGEYAVRVPQDSVRSQSAAAFLCGRGDFGMKLLENSQGTSNRWSVERFEGAIFLCEPRGSFGMGAGR